jgi:hypothetical protein
LKLRPWAAVALALLCGSSIASAQTKLTERGTRIEMHRLPGGASIALGEPRARLLAYAISGAGHSGGAEWCDQTAWQIEAGETATIAASAPAELLVIVLPTLDALTPPI